MIKLYAALLTLCTAPLCAAQSSVAAAQTAPKHFRLTFVLSYPKGEQPSQSFVLDVPVTNGRMGMSGVNSAAGLTGQVEGSVQESLQCTDVQESATGLAARVSFDMDSVRKPMPGSTEPVHSHLAFNRQIDLVLGKPTLITQEMHRRALRPLGKGNDGVAGAPPAAPEITVTAIEM